MAGLNNSEVEGYLEIARRSTIAYKNTLGDGTSIADVAKIGRVEPITLVSSSLKSTKELYDIQQGILNIYAAFYIQATSILATKRSDARILKILDSVNPDRDLNTLLTATNTISAEDLKVRMERLSKQPSMENFRTKDELEVASEKVKNMRRYLGLEGLELGTPKDFNGKYGIALESIFGSATSTAKNLGGEFVEDITNTNNRYESINSYGTIGVKKIDAFDKTDKVVGKIIEISFKGGNGRNDEVKIPVVIKLDNMFVPYEVVRSIMTQNKDSIKLGSRLEDLFAGKISFIKDFIMCSDLIAKQKANLMKDPTRAYATMLGRVNSSKMYSALSRNISLSTISGIMIISEEDENAIKREIGGDLTNKMTRNMVFDNSSVMIIAVVDRDYEQVSIYVRDVDGHSQMPFNRFKESNTAGNDALTDAFKSLTMGRVPSF